MVVAERVVGAAVVLPGGGKSRARSISDTVLLPEFAINAVPVSSLMATPIGSEPTVTAGTAWAPVSRLSTEAVPSALLVTTARPKRGLTATPIGLLPVAMVFEAVNPPNPGLFGSILMME